MAYRINVNVNDGEKSTEAVLRCMRTLSKIMKEDGYFDELEKHRYYQKPSERQHAKDRKRALTQFYEKQIKLNTKWGKDKTSKKNKRRQEEEFDFGAEY